MKRFLLLCLFSQLALGAGAQTTPPAAGEETSSSAAMVAQAAASANALSQFASDDYLLMRLPPLEELLENAMSTSRIAYFEREVEMEQSELKTVRRNWLHYIKLYTGYQYGQLNDLATSSDYMIPGEYYAYMGRKQNYWNAGATLNIPLDEIFNRRNLIKQQKARIERAEANIGREHEQLALEVIDAYTVALSQLSMIKVRSEAVTVATAQYKIAESDFVNGKINAHTLSVQKNIESAALREYEQTRESINNALLRLEFLTRTRIINRP